MSNTPPSVLILGGVAQGTASAFLCYLWDTDPSTKQRRASHIRLVDKFLIIPQADVFLKWMDPAARKVLKDNHGKGIEYIQGNLANEETRTKVFLAPTGRAYDVVFDLSQGDAAVSGSDEVLVEAVAKQAKLNGLEAMKNGGVGAYIRQTDPFVTMPSKKCPLKENDTEIRPTTAWTKWSMEGTRALADIENLPLIVARIANPWGPSVLVGFTRRMVIASVYKYLGSGETMEFLWGKDLVLEHIHSYDLASAFYALSQWQRLTAKTRQRANKLAGSPLAPCRPGSIPSDSETSEGSGSGSTSKLDMQEVDGLVGREKTVIAPVFNVSDGSGQTQEDLAKVLEKVMGIKVDFYSALTNAMAKMNMSEVVEIADEKHQEPFLLMLSESKPPISNSPFSPSLPAPLLRKNRCHMDNSKIKSMTGWKPKFGKISSDEVKKIVEGFKKDGIWPNASPRRK